MKFRELQIEEVASVLGFSTAESSYRQKLLRMGLTRRTEFIVKQKAPLGGPVEIEVRGSRVVLRSDEADVLEVEKVCPA